MSKKATKRGRDRRGRRVKAGKAVVAATALILVAAAAAVTRLSPARRPGEPAAPGAQSQQDLRLSKEYVYAGGRLVATEEPAPAATPTPTPAGPAPTSLVATATLPSPMILSVSLTWSAPSSGTVSSYIVERAEGMDAAGQPQYAAAGPPVTTPPTPSSPYVDQTAQPGKVYLYRVKAVFSSGVTSPYSNQDIATTVRYMGDDPLIGRDDSQGRRASPVRAEILIELRGVVDSVRALAGLTGAAWRDEPPGNPRPAPGVLIRAWHFEELRTHLNQALSELDISEVPADTTLSVGQPIRARHIQDVRDRVR